ncbi:hypothetical protein OCH239_12990 [Roseivivax halodurans JCM 10272]|uniref:Uncharacterized protein n=2 Tax=Roseivivax halodurans TaxID=93683 RepID=X7EBC7_9RHOB|nr:hypothetical protein OCH239_12990 [Roseivivax halodurans JCM 10272]
MIGETAQPPHIAFFGHNPGDAAVKRRMSAFCRAGFEVTGVMPHRGPLEPPDWPHIDLGETRDNDYAGRLKLIRRSARLLAPHIDRLRSADVIYARNLDMLMLAYRLRRQLRLGGALVYECLDIHHRLTGDGMAARLLRGIERRLLRECALVVVSSPRFESEHFARYFPGLAPVALLENRLVEGDAFGPRPDPAQRPGDGPLRIGWFGNLRCRRSFDVLSALAARCDGRVQIVLRGYPARSVFPEFEAEVSAAPHMEWHGRYAAPLDLSWIYADVDLVWAADWYEEGANSLWLLPNRIYEGGYFATPAIAVRGTETARWLVDRSAGFVIDEPVSASLERLISRLLKDPAEIVEARQTLLGLPRETFVESPEIMRALIDRVAR